MITTFNGCYLSDIKVHPKNWKTGKATLDQDWYFYYRFYDPTVTDAKGKIKPLLVIGKGMNKFKKLSERRHYTESLIRDEIKHLVNDGFNPITTSYMIDHEEIFQGDIPPDTPFIEALKMAREKLSVGHRTSIGIKSVIKGVEKAAIQLRLQDFTVDKVGRKHLKKILERCEEIADLSATRYNLYRAYLLMLFNELVEQEAVAGNPVRDIKKRITTQTIKPVPSDEDRERIKDHLKEAFPRFCQFVHLFFHSGGRKTELVQLKPSMVNLETQKYRCVIKKRKKYVEVERTIKDVAVPYWKFFLQDCPEDKFIFGTRFLPGDKPMGADMPSRYWQEYVKAPVEKGGLGITIDFYSLKHLNTTETVDYFEQLMPQDAEKMAAGQNAHTSEAMVISIYDVKQRDRQHERLKRVNNDF